jgi:hypothetical protein
MVKITKLRESANPVVKAGDPETYQYGQLNDVSVPIDYTVEGELIEPITIGRGVFVNRSKRNGVAAPGIFQTSPVVKIKKNGFETQNSVYLVENL